ncbi:MAG: hypothetical protein PF440_09745 [Thiomicrorhabdus sp.]|nr:hypothetical protein [Thiomicrorhabdus sp.]
MSWLIVKSTERKATALQVDRSGDHLWGDVIDIIPDDVPVDHLVPEPFLAIKVSAEKVDLVYLQESLEGIYRKRYGLKLEDLPAQTFAELCGTGKTTVTVPILESVIDCRGL